MNQKKINFNKHKVNHFIEQKFPKRIIGTNSNKVVLFLEREIQTDWNNKITQIFESVFEIKFIGFKIVESYSKLVIFFYKKEGLNIDVINSYRTLAETMINKILKTKYYLVLIDYNFVWKSSQITEKDFHKIAVEVIKTEKKYVFPVLKKETRKKINLWAIQYDHIKINGTGNYATKKITVSYKK